MDFRRIPFQFSSTDPAKRQSELQKRFGIPPKPEKMLVDIANPGFLDARRKESNSASSSPRLQHRVPKFDGMSEADKSDANPTNVDAGQKPRVRIVPIEIENPDGTKRHRTLSGSSCSNSNLDHPGSWNSDDVRPKVESLSSKLSSGPKIFNIPVKIDGINKSSKAKASRKDYTPKPVLQNGCNVTKLKNSEENNAPEPPTCDVSMKKINTVLEKLIGYQVDVEKFSGSTKEKQYRYLDEMLTRLMLDLDDVETMGNENIRLARKAAIKKVQHCIDLLESKVNDNSQNQSVSTAGVLEEGVQEQPCDAEKKTEEKVPDVASSKAVGGQVDDFNVPDIEMEDATTDAFVPDAMASTDAQRVQLMETENDQTVSTETNKKSESELKLAESKTELPDVQMLSDKLDNDSKESEISEVEMEDKACSQELETSVEVNEVQIEPCQEISVVESDKSKPEKDCLNLIEACDASNEQSSIGVSNLIAQTEVSLSTEGVGQSVLSETIPDVQTGSSLESKPSKHSHIPSIEKAIIEEVPKKLKVQN